jgi:L-2,4-diaminobutyric acid acetyltransferase
VFFIVCVVSICSRYKLSKTRYGGLMNARNDLFENKLRLRHPQATDGYLLNQLVASCPPLDTNSVYCNLLQCQHFAETSVAAVVDDRLVGFISAYLLPNDPETLFVWQVVVDAKFRGQGVAKRMLNWLVAQPGTGSARQLITSITPDNRASWMLFESLARDWHAQPIKEIMFERERHFAGHHDDEYLLRIAPLPDRSQDTIARFYSDLRSCLRHPSGKRWLD